MALSYNVTEDLIGNSIIIDVPNLKYRIEKFPKSLIVDLSAQYEY